MTDSTSIEIVIEHLIEQGRLPMAGVVKSLQADNTRLREIIDRLLTCENVYDAEVKLMRIGGDKFGEEHTEFRCWWCETEYNEEQAECTDAECPAVIARAALHPAEARADGAQGVDDG